MVVLPAVRFELSSTPTLTDVIAASVDRGMISEMVATKVVLPAPKPPAITILTGVGACPADRSEGTKAIEHPFQEIQVIRSGFAPARTAHLDETLGGHVADEHPRHPERHLQVSRHLGH